MINVLEPQSELLKRFVDNIYVFKRGMNGFEFTAYPTMNTPVGLFRDTVMNCENDTVYISNSATPSHFAIACNQFTSSIHLQYLQLTDEIAINFKPLGFSSFTRSTPGDKKIFRFPDWDHLLPHLFNKVFAEEDHKKQLYHIEQFLTGQYKQPDNETILLRALELLNDTTKEYKIQEIAGLLGVHYKQLYRHFSEQVGCSPAHYRKLVKFRTSMVSKIKKGSEARLVDICYDNAYTDQPYFTRQFKEFTGEKPVAFFKGVTSFGNEQVIFKIN